MTCIHPRRHLIMPFVFVWHLRRLLSHARLIWCRCCFNFGLNITIGNRIDAESTIANFRRLPEIIILTPVTLGIGTNVPSDAISFAVPPPHKHANEMNGRMAAKKAEEEKTNEPRQSYMFSLCSRNMCAVNTHMCSYALEQILCAGCCSRRVRICAQMCDVDIGQALQCIGGNGCVRQQSVVCPINAMPIYLGVICKSTDSAS